MGESNCGLVRNRNEDSFCLAAYDNENSALAVIADGIGGQRDGDIASFFCCHRLLTAWQRRANPGGMSGEDAAAFLRTEIQQVNSQLYLYNRRERYTQAMGTTVAAAVFLPRQIVTAHAGDSRVYRLNTRGSLSQLTEDHTLINKLSASGKLPMNIAPHELSHIISRAIGPRSQVEVDVRVFDRGAGDRYLLCSDGMTRYVDNDKLGGILTQAASPRAATNELMRLSLIAGGADNISIICGFSAPAG